MTMHNPHWSNIALDQIARRFKLLSEPSRLRLLFALNEGEKSVGDLIAITNMAQGNVSQQLGILADGGLIIRHRNRQQVIYRLADSLTFELNTMVVQSLIKTGELVVSSLSNEELENS